MEKKEEIEEESNNKLKIYFISHDIERSGAPLYLLNLSKDLGDSYDIEVLSPSYDPSRRVEEFAFQIMPRENMVQYIIESIFDWEDYYEKIPFNSISRDKNSVLQYFFERGHQEFPLTHGTRPILLIMNTIVMGSLITTFKKYVPFIPILWVIHENLGFQFCRVHFQLTPEPFKVVDKIICVSESTKRMWEQYTDPSKIGVLYTGLKKEEMIEKKKSIPRETLRAQFGLNNAFVIVIVGAVEERKAQRDFVHHVLPIIKVEKPECYEKIRVILVGHEIYRTLWPENVLYLGSQKNVFPFLGASDLFLCNSKNEALPLCVLEAMATGTPIVSTDVDGIAEELEHGKSGLLYKPGQHALCAKYIIDIMESDSLRKSLIDEAEKRFDELFSHERYIQQWKEILDQYK